jgi:hypothetical protein
VLQVDKIEGQNGPVKQLQQQYQHPGELYGGAGTRETPETPSGPRRGQRTALDQPWSQLKLKVRSGFMGITICKTHGRAGFVETCAHVAEQIDDRKRPSGRRLFLLPVRLFVCKVFVGLSPSYCWARTSTSRRSKSCLRAIGLPTFLQELFSGSTASDPRMLTDADFERTRSTQSPVCRQTQDRTAFHY